jgi:hypothetical protein
MKMYKEGIDNAGLDSLADKGEITSAHNDMVRVTYNILMTGLSDDDFDTSSLEIQTSDVFVEAEVDKFLSEHEIFLEDRSYYDADQRFIYFDTVTGKLRQI